MPFCWFCYVLAHMFIWRNKKKTDIYLSPMLENEPMEMCILHLGSLCCELCGYQTMNTTAPEKKNIRKMFLLLHEKGTSDVFVCLR